MSYKHLSIEEREKLLFHLAQGQSICQIAALLERHKSTVARELKRNDKDYLPSKAQAAYHKRRKNSCPHKKLEQPELFALVKKLFLKLHWSPEQISNRLKLETYPIRISYKTIYRAIYAGMFDTPEQRRSTGNRGAIRKLRHRGKPRRTKGSVSNRGKIPISHELSARPVEANERSRFGDFEADTIVGKNRKSGISTARERNGDFGSRVLLCAGASAVAPRHQRKHQRLASRVFSERLRLQHNNRRAVTGGR